MRSDVKKYSWHVDAGCMVEEADGAYVESEDHEREVQRAIAAGIRMQDKCAALDAEIARLKAVLVGAEYPKVDNLKNLTIEECSMVGAQVASLTKQAIADRDADRAKLAAIRAADVEPAQIVGTVHAQPTVNDVYMPVLAFKKSVPPGTTLMTVAQHQRITAAMAAGVETWKGMTKEAHEYHSAAMIELARILGGDVSDEPRLKWVCGIATDVVSERDALRAELAEVKGRKPDCFVVGKSDKIAVIDSPLPVGTKLYTTPPASPDVEGLVKALEQAIADIEDWAAYASPYFQEKHDLAGCLENHRTALSTWRQSHP